MCSLIVNKSYSYLSCSWATYYAVKRKQPVGVDGDLSEWAAVPLFTRAQERFFFVGQGMSSAKQGGPQDLSGICRAQQQLHWSGMSKMFSCNSQFFGTFILINE